MAGIVKIQRVKSFMPAAFPEFPAEVPSMAPPPRFFPGGGADSMAILSQNPGALNARLAPWNKKTGALGKKWGVAVKFPLQIPMS